MNIEKKDETLSYLQTKDNVEVDLITRPARPALFTNQIYFICHVARLYFFGKN